MIPPLLGTIPFPDGCTVHNPQCNSNPPLPQPPSTSSLSLPTYLRKWVNRSTWARPRHIRNDNNDAVQYSSNSG
jgi:hypothetical protein